jgi:signal transduction histidine kinase
MDEIVLTEDATGIRSAIESASFPAVCGAGNGMEGLAIVKHIAQLHGGEAMVSSKPGEGAKFTLVI